MNLDFSQDPFSSSSPSSPSSPSCPSLLPNKFLVNYPYYIYLTHYKFSGCYILYKQNNPQELITRIFKDVNKPQVSTLDINGVEQSLIRECQEGWTLHHHVPDQVKQTNVSSSEGSFNLLSTIQNVMSGFKSM